MVYFCPNCFSKIIPKTDFCPHCQHYITDWENYNFDEKLTHALNHPDSFTRRRAAFLLGKRKANSAYSALQNAFQNSVDPYFKAEILQALLKINRRKALKQFDREKIKRESVIVQKVIDGSIAEENNDEKDDNE